MAQIASKSCELCMSGPGNNYCEQCEQWMCENCKTLHLRSKICRNHTFLNGSHINPEVNPFCKEHDENFIFYCIDCDMPLCKICSVKKHKKHDMSEINESTKELQTEVKKIIESKIKSVKKNLNKIKQGTEEYQSEIKEAIRVITEDGKLMKQWIDKKVQALITSLEEIESANMKVFQSINTGFQKDLGKFVECQTAFNECQKVVNASKLLTQLKNIKAEVDIEGEKQLPVIPKVKYNKRNVSEREMFNLFGDVSLKEIVYNEEQSSKKKTSVQLTKTMNIYTCSHCGVKLMSELEPIIDYDHYEVFGNELYCDRCRQKRWFYSDSRR